ncbi:nectin-1 isoform X1 [Acanthochromis polyacanthus]|uniref:nectin-1 isoform X2 n=1 Tax=Acanthochromis polyacanthus TaxID=80966 RepID=UPI0022347792|nr:nectin-1 isoform X2 [Acanthochromis polyacanthus]XP_051815167.1 nectin-1 isoform X1 [Acanthochromis polyacanthus]XP_051815168.1 nectin-1 isoform X1 [Acanthochromis polyacanthus]
MAYTMLLLLLLHQVRETKALRVIGGEKTVVQDGNAVLPCILIETQESLSQISWQRRTREKPQNDNFYTILPTTGPQFVGGEDKRFTFIGNFKGNNGTLLLSSVTLMDEGIYTCIFTLFPSGSHKTEIPLNVLVPPVTSLESNTPTVGKDEVLFATCTAAVSKPPAEVKWNISPLGEKVRAATSATQYTNGTTTTISSLFGVPTLEVNNQSVPCVVTSEALANETLPFTIQVQFPPMEVNIIKTSPNTFECESKANPPANFTWKRSGEAVSQPSVTVDGAKLQFLSWTPDLNDLYECEASNQHGNNSHKLYIQVVVVKDCCVAGWVLFALLLILNALWACYKFELLRRIIASVRGRQPVATSSNSPVRAQESLQVQDQQAEVEKISNCALKTLFMVIIFLMHIMLFEVYYIFAPIISVYLCCWLATAMFLGCSCHFCGLKRSGMPGRNFTVFYKHALLDSKKNLLELGGQMSNKFRANLGIHAYVMLKFHTNV